MSRITAVCERQNLRSLLEHVTEREGQNPRYPIFSVYVARRTPLYLRYEPVSQYQNGPLARVGDHCLLGDRGRNVIRDAKGRVHELDPQDPEVRAKHLEGRSPIFLRRGAEKIILEDVGTFRWMVVKNYDPEARRDSKHHQYSEDGELRYDPEAKALYLVRGMYNDEVKSDGRIGRYGQWRPFAQICLKSCVLVRCADRNGQQMEWTIPDPQDHETGRPLEVVLPGEVELIA